MNFNKKYAPVRMPRKTAIGMNELIEIYIKSMKISSGLNIQRIFAAWDAVSGASAYTLNRRFYKGKLYITLSSSMVRSHLRMQNDFLIERMNAFLEKDELFIKDDKFVRIVKSLILK